MKPMNETDETGETDETNETDGTTSLKHVCQGRSGGGLGVHERGVQDLWHVLFFDAVHPPGFR